MNIIGMLVRDIVVCCEGDFDDYIVEGTQLVYRWGMPFNIVLGKYKFMNYQEYYNLKLKDLVK